MSDGNSGTTATASPPSAAELADGLDRILRHLRRVGAAGAADRIERVARTISTTPSAIDAEEVERLIDPERVIDERTAAYGRLWRKKNAADPRGFFARFRDLFKSVRVAHLVRNLFGLAPLIFTWLALGWAVREYQASGGTGSLLIFWQDHGFVSFETVAFIDVGLLGIVVACTWWVHRTESAAEKFATSVYDAVGRLKESVRAGGRRTPVSADDWATEADRIIRSALDEVRKLATTSQDILKKASGELAGTQKSSLELVKQLHAGNEKFLADFQNDTKATISQFSEAVLNALTSVRQQNETFIENTRKENERVLQDIVQRQISPLLQQLGDLVGQFAAQAGTATAAAGELRGAVAALHEPAAELAGSAREVAGHTQSINGSLEKMARAQEQFTARVDGTAQSMITAAASIGEVRQTLQEALVPGVQEMADNVTQASSSLGQAQAGLADTTSALREAAQNFRTATEHLVPATAPGRDLQQAIDRLTTAIKDLRSPWPWRRRRSDGFGAR